jgi:hypothetical protein
MVDQELTIQESVTGLRAVLEDQSWSPFIDLQRIFMRGIHLVELGGSARVLVYQNNYHAFINGLGDSPTAEHALGEMIEFIFS